MSTIKACYVDTVVMARKIKDFNEYSEKTRIGAQLFNEKQYEEALNIFLELSQYNSLNFKVFETLALIYLKLNNVNAAQEAYERALELFSENSRVSLKFQTFDDAVSQLESIDKLISLYDKECELYGDGKENEKRSEMAIHRLPVMMGMQYMAQGEFKKAEELLVAHREKYFAGK